MINLGPLEIEYSLLAVGYSSFPTQRIPPVRRSFNEGG